MMLALICPVVLGLDARVETASFLRSNRSSFQYLTGLQLP